MGQILHVRTVKKRGVFCCGASIVRDLE